MSDMHYYGCCACIGSAGIGILPMIQLCSSDDGVAVNLFINGRASSKTPQGRALEIVTVTDYPRDAKVALRLNLEATERFVLRIRDPYWSKTTTASVNGKEGGNKIGGYIEIDREWTSGDKIEIELDMRVEAIRPIPYGSQVLMNEVIWECDHMIPTFDREDPIASKHIALRRGPIMLAQDSRLGYSVDDPISPVVKDDCMKALESTRDIPYPCIVKIDIPTADGYVTLTDYASAGKLWSDDDKIAVWILTV